MAALKLVTAIITVLAYLDFVIFIAHTDGMASLVKQVYVY